MNQVQKLDAVNARLGSTAGAGQQTTRYIYDTVGFANGQSFGEFFKTFAGKSEFQTNLTTNKLDSSESMVIKSIYMVINPSDAATPETLLGHMNLNITVGNQVVLKDFNPAFLVGDRGLAFDRLHADLASTNATDDRTCEFRLLTDIVIPPQVNFDVKLQMAEPFAGDGGAITIGLKGYGTIFSAGGTF